MTGDLVDWRAVAVFSAMAIASVPVLAVACVAVTGRMPTNGQWLLWLIAVSLGFNAGRWFA